MFRKLTPFSQFFQPRLFLFRHGNLSPEKRSPSFRLSCRTGAFAYWQPEGARCSHFARLQGPVHKCPVLSGVPTRARRRHVRQKGREKNMVATYAGRFCLFFCCAQGWTQNLEFDIFKAVLARCGTSGVTVQRLRLVLLLKGQGSSPAVGFFYLFC